MKYLYRSDHEITVWSIAKRGLYPAEAPRKLWGFDRPPDGPRVYLTETLKQAGQYAVLVVAANLAEFGESQPVTAIRVRADAVEDAKPDEMIPGDFYVTRLISPQDIEAWDLKEKRWFPVLEVQDQSGIVVKLTGEDTHEKDAARFVRKYWPKS